MGKGPLAMGLAAVLTLLVALAQSTGSGETLEGFFGAVMSGLGEAMAPLSSQAPSSGLEACQRDGIPTELHIDRVGTTRSPFCPGEVTATARSSTDEWRTLIDRQQTPQAESVKQKAVRSGRVTEFRVEYVYNPLLYRWYAEAQRYPVAEDGMPECDVIHDLQRVEGEGTRDQIPDSLLLFDRITVSCRFSCSQGEPGCRCDSQGRNCYIQDGWSNAYGDYVTPTIVGSRRRYP